MFEPGKEVIAYNDGEDLMRVVEYYLSHSEEAAELARRGQERTLRDHSAAVRAKEFLGLCEKMLASP
jgi:spore maturation protein CgeB